MDYKSDIAKYTQASINDKAVDAGRVFVTLGQAVAGSTQDVSHGTPGVVILDGVRAGDMAGLRQWDEMPRTLLTSKR